MGAEFPSSTSRLQFEAVIARLGKVELHITMTTRTNIALAELAAKGADADLLKDTIQYVAQRMMDLDAASLCAMAYGERSPERLNSRSGYRERLWETRRIGRFEDPEAAQRTCPVSMRL